MKKKKNSNSKHEFRVVPEEPVGASVRAFAFSNGFSCMYAVSFSLECIAFQSDHTTSSHYFIFSIILFFPHYFIFFCGSWWTKTLNKHDQRTQNKDLHKYSPPFFFFAHEHDWRENLATGSMDDEGALKHPS